ncbi:hypothetical protein AN958_10422 [Leucoagaricus sp. SymC.cos]|nr:hypothetical protein AN958_10422 [Leucoagaricus sp. SymC.cos]
MIKACLAQAKIAPELVKGLGFDATCSLAVTDLQGEPITVTKGGNIGLRGERNILLWADHRAEKEADLINTTGSVVLDYVGGRMSLKMEVPKVLWLKNNIKAERFSNCQFFYLSDFLTYGATKDTTLLEEVLEQLRVESDANSLTELTKDLHIYPDFHDLAMKYNATLEATALQTRHIIAVLSSRGHSISSIHMSGGHAKNLALMQLFASVCDMPMILPQDHAAAVVRGAAILGRFAAEGGGMGDDVDQAKALWKVMVEMTPAGALVLPSASRRDKRLLNAKFKIFMETIDIQRRWRVEMEDAVR